MNNITLLLSASLFLLKETNIHTISVLIYHVMRNVSVRSAHRLAVRASQYCTFWRILYLGLAHHPNADSLLQYPFRTKMNT
jgi:hypothetical protein